MLLEDVEASYSDCKVVVAQIEVSISQFGGPYRTKFCLSSLLQNLIYARAFGRHPLERTDYIIRSQGKAFLGGHPPRSPVFSKEPKGPVNSSMAKD